MLMGPIGEEEEDATFFHKNLDRLITLKPDVLTGF
jgi:hypothetical protein